ncbi:hypothetical protein GCM10011506_29410 [Marivirga lumbricoides]|uniref:GyrI-like small molecule binding domain-containing protein n=2 Tax=Marivirga lumbricoides TaxID=1046115 RepID=A0ABQ1MLS1_9BACT|nr:hypothetical protein GCM10011506_29410 [Marivirga lumbricoides]
MNKKFVILGLILLLAVIIYYWLGGFKSIRKEIIKDTNITVLGFYYEGKIGSDSLQNLFEQARQLVLKEEYAKSIALVYYGEPNENTGEVKNFIGVQTDNTAIKAKPYNWEYRKFKRNKSIMGCIEANVLAMPTPDDMVSELKSFALENEVALDSIFIEYYRGPNNVCVELLSK